MTWFHRLVRRRRLEEQLRKELDFHVEEHTADLIARGCDAAEARRRARLEFGGIEQIKEHCREARGTRWLEDLGRDIRLTFRALGRQPGFSAVAIITLAVGVGATTIMFSVVNGVLLKPLPYLEPDRLVSLQEQTDYSTQFGNQWAFAYPNYVDIGRHVHAVAPAAWRFGAGGMVTGSGDPEYVPGFQVSANLFSMLGVPLERGRDFREDEDRAGGARVAIISYRYWRRHYHASADALGQSLLLDGTPYTVVGILPDRFQLIGDGDVFTPLGQSPARQLTNRSMHPGIQVWARLRPGATLQDARAQLATLGRQLAQQYPDSNRGRTFVATPLRPEVGSTRSTLWLLFGAVSLVLLIACANVASLLLARAVTRHRELVLRAAVGASRGRLVRQCLAESSTLGIVGGGCGLVLAAVGLPPFIAAWPGTLPRVEDVHLDWRVLLFALVLSLVSSIACGLAPAVRVPRQNIEHVLRTAGRTVGGHSRRLHGAFVTAEVALAIVLLVCAGVLGRTLLRVSALDPGVDTANVLVTRMALSPATLTDADRTRAAWQSVLDRARTVAGVEAAAIVDTVPMRQGDNQLVYSTSATLPRLSERRFALATCVTADYLRVMGLSLRMGRFFDDRDLQNSPPVVVIDDVLARSAFGTDAAVGRQIWIPDLGPDAFEVVGVVKHVRHWGLASDDQASVRAQFYYPFAQLPDRFVRRWSELMSLAVRTSIPPLTVVDSLRHELRGPAGDHVLYQQRTLDELANNSLARGRFLLMLFGVFAAVALLLACVGLYGVLSFLTSQRVPEIGARMAMGATGGQILQMIVQQSLWLVVVGALAGTAAALAATRLLQSNVDGVRAVELSTMAMMVSVLIAAALLAAYIPARRASRLDVMIALRQD